MRYDDLKPQLSGVTVISLQEETLRLDSLWESRAVLLAFLRHFG